MTPFPQPLSEITRWLIGLAPSQEVRLNPSDFRQVYIHKRDCVQHQDEQLLGMLPEGPRKFDRFYLILEDGSPILIVCDSTISVGHFSP